MSKQSLHLLRNGSAIALAALLIAGGARAAGAAPSVKEVVKTYADIAHAGYEDATSEARKLKSTVDALLATPSEASLKEARRVWIEARAPYMQTEAFRFGNKIVDDWEGEVNSWPLDEGLIDYVGEAYGEGSPDNPLGAANVIANRKLKIAGKDVDASKITKTLLSKKLQEANGVEANVATGYHAVEFLLWGQDLNGTGPGAGKRPATDYDTKNCTGGNCDRRRDYLRAATDLLVDDLAEMAGNWGKSGAARKQVMSGKGDAALVTIFTGMGSLSYGELAGERMKLGLLIHDPEEEHDCFSDNTHNSHFYDAMGIRNVYLGRYKRVDGVEVKGPSVSDLVAAKSADIDKALKEKLDATMDAMKVIVTRAEGGEAYDQMIGEGNEQGNKAVQTAIDALLDQTKEIERAVAALDLKSIEFEGSDSLDNPEKAAN